MPDINKNDLTAVMFENLVIRISADPDDIPWCKEKLYREGVKLVFAEKYGPVEQLCLMSTFDKFILANSTFSWWGAYLSQKKKIIIRPNYHFGKKWNGILCWDDYYPMQWQIFDHKK